MPMYHVIVPDKEGNPLHERLVDAPNQASARSNVARALFQVSVAKGRDVVRLTKDGVDLITVGDDAE